MNQYDKAYVPDKKGDFEASLIDSFGPELGRLSLKQNVIVLTIEELRECFGWHELEYGNRIVDEAIFKKYLISKGIKI